MTHGARTAPAREPFLPFGAVRDHPATLCGLACLFSWIELLFCFEGILRDQVELAGGLVHDPLFGTATLAAALILAATAVLARVGRPGRARTTGTQADNSARHAHALARFTPQAARAAFASCRVLCACTALGIICSVGATLLAGFWPTAPTALARCAGAGVGVFAAWGTLAWGERLARCDLREVLLVVSGAACVQWLPFLVVPVLPSAVQAALVALLALGTGVALARTRTDDPYEAHDTERAGGVSGTGADNPGDGGRLPALAGVAFAFSLVIEFVWCFFIKMLPGRLGPELFPAMFALVIVATGIVMAACVCVMERQRGYRLELYYRLMMLFSLCGVAATGAVAPGESSAWQLGMYTLVYLGYSLSGPTMWLLTLGYSHMRRCGATGVLACVFCAKYLGLLCGFSIIDTMKACGLGELVGPDIVAVAVLACVVVLAVAYLLVFPERELLSLSPLLFGMSSESVERRCAQIAAEHGLTPRETEVLTLLARGRDVGFICEKLCIARNTVNAHRKSIYAKLEIHSQQELLTIVEGQQG